MCTFTLLFKCKEFVWATRSSLLHVFCYHSVFTVQTIHMQYIYVNLCEFSHPVAYACQTFDIHFNVTVFLTLLHVKSCILGIFSLLYRQNSSKSRSSILIALGKLTIRKLMKTLLFINYSFYIHKRNKHVTLMKILHTFLFVHALVTHTHFEWQKPIKYKKQIFQ